MRFSRMVLVVFTLLTTCQVPAYAVRATAPGNATPTTNGASISVANAPTPTPTPTPKPTPTLKPTPTPTVTPTDAMPGPPQVAFNGTLPTTTTPSPDPPSTESSDGSGSSQASVDIGTPPPVVAVNQGTNSPPPIPTIVLATLPVQTATYVRQETASPSAGDGEQDIPEIIGGRADRKPSSATTSSVPVTPHVYQVLQYFLGLATATSMVVLIGSHGAAVDDRFDWSSKACAPNTWEFVVYTSYLQHLMSLAQMVLVKTPYSLWTVLDGFSWTGFLPYHSNDSAIKTAANTHGARRLETILLSGVVAFADRVGVNEAELLVRTVTGLAFFAGVCLVVFFGVAAVTKSKMDHHANHPSQRNPAKATRLIFWRSISMRVCGGLVLLWFFSLYPLSVMSAYEMSMEIRAKTVSLAQLLLMAIAMLVVCLGGLLVVGSTVASKTAYELRQSSHIAAWGCLYADYTHDKRYFLLVPVLLQIATGVIVGSVTSDVTQLALLIAIHVMFLLAFVLAKPFLEGSVAAWFVCVLAAIKLVNLTIAVAFIGSNNWTPRARSSAADVVVWLNAMLIIFWLLRHVGTLAQIARCLRNGTAAREQDATLSNGGGFIMEQEMPSSERSMGSGRYFHHDGSFRLEGKKHWKRFYSQQL